MNDREEVGVRTNDPCFLTPDLHRMITYPKQWVLVRHVIEWLVAIPNSHRRQAFVEFQFRSDAEDPLFPYREIEDFELEYWEIDWCDFITYGARNQHVKVIARITPTDEFHAYVKAGGMQTMSRMSVKAEAVRQQLAAVHVGELYPTDVALVQQQVKRAVGWCLLPERSEAVRVLDVCAGPGVYGIVAKQRLEGLGYSVELHGIEMNSAFEKPPEFDFWHVGDFRTFDSLGLFHIILTNPPFSLGGEVALYANRHLVEKGAFSMLIGANFAYSDKDGRGELFEEYPPSQYVLLMSRPGFYFSFAEKAKIKERFGSSPRGTNANEHQIIEWDQRPPQPPVRVKWKYYNAEDPIHQQLQERGSMVICALAFEAAKEVSAAKREKREPVTFTDHFSLLAANRWKWDFFHSTTAERRQARLEIIREKSRETLGVSDA